jgi:hypothetical protein
MIEILSLRSGRPLGAVDFKRQVMIAQTLQPK